MWKDREQQVCPEVSLNETSLMPFYTEKAEMRSDEEAPQNLLKREFQEILMQRFYSKVCNFPFVNGLIRETASHHTICCKICFSLKVR